MNDTSKETKSNKGCWFVILKIAGTILAVYAIEYLLHWTIKAGSNDALAVALSPFHNNYISLSNYYLTSADVSSQTADIPSASLRFVIYYILGYVIFTVLSLLMGVLPKVKKYAERITTVLFYAVFVVSFLLAFFFPTKITKVDLQAKEIVVTDYSYGFIPSSNYIPFSEVKQFTYTLTHNRDYNQTFSYYAHFVTLLVEQTDGRKTQIGDMEIGEADGNKSMNENIKPSAETMKKVEKVLSLLNNAIGKR